MPFARLKIRQQFVEWSQRFRTWCEFWSSNYGRHQGTPAESGVDTQNKTQRPRSGYRTREDSGTWKQRHVVALRKQPKTRIRGRPNAFAPADTQTWIHECAI